MMDEAGSAGTQLSCELAQLFVYYVALDMNQ
jgi:hypothetical protein